MNISPMSLLFGVLVALGSSESKLDSSIEGGIHITDHLDQTNSIIDGSESTSSHLSHTSTDIDSELYDYRVAYNDYLNEHQINPIQIRQYQSFSRRIQDWFKRLAFATGLKYLRKKTRTVGYMPEKYASGLSYKIKPNLILSISKAKKILKDDIKVFKKPHYVHGASSSKTDPGSSKTDPEVLTSKEPTPLSFNDDSESSTSDQLPLQKISKVKLVAESQSQCAICQTEFQSPKLKTNSQYQDGLLRFKHNIKPDIQFEAISCVKKCGHCFHPTCIKSWFDLQKKEKKLLNCPLCRE
ncbi:hypothetical protein PGT21_030803 [Puccinia graminis f. sp. tritici]|uniref:RING-type domain-containing protein n=1 Tax=Puccinia graminis f. sp. tritici TaxID=56615 RepID=A0A5B0NF49_PUCGR|nr:hypothetical protein PGT21_030803 [Puccinia graminis f. sp. tritici]KAA1095684.1 hypothetical protein PGTUg99_022638 [Puccinia graminis f. sp. tritici]